MKSALHAPRAPMATVILIGRIAWAVTGLVILTMVFGQGGAAMPVSFAGVLGTFGVADGHAGAGMTAPRPAHRRAFPLVGETGLAAEITCSGGEQATSDHAAGTAKGLPFLGFVLPNDGFSVDRRQRFEVVPTWSRVGFDGTTPIDSFSAVSSAMAGDLEACPAQPEADPVARLAVEARSLSTGDPGRDRVLHEGLAVAEHPEISFEMRSFEAGETDLEHACLRGVARCAMKIRGVEVHLSFDVDVHLDDENRLVIEGEAPLSLSALGVQVPTTLGIPKMGDVVTLWIALRARHVGASPPGSAVGQFVANAPEVPSHVR